MALLNELSYDSDESRKRYAMELIADMEQLAARADKLHDRINRGLASRELARKRTRSDTFIGPKPEFDPLFEYSRVVQHRDDDSADDKEDLSLLKKCQRRCNSALEVEPSEEKPAGQDACASFPADFAEGSDEWAEYEDEEDADDYDEDEEEDGKDRDNDDGKDLLKHSAAKKAREISETETYFIPVLPDRVAFEEMMKGKPTEAKKHEWMKKNSIEVADKADFYDKWIGMSEFEKAAYIEAHQRKGDYGSDAVDNK
ncbi:unnamed protein product [Calypogeia fissa]